MKIIDNESAIRTMMSDLKSTLRLLNGACRDRRIEPRDGCAYLKEHKHGCRSCRIGRLKERIKSHLEAIEGCQISYDQSGGLYAVNEEIRM